MHRLALAALLVPALVLAEPHPERLGQIMDRLAKSQAALQTKQENLLVYASRPHGTDRTRTFVEERLRDLKTAQQEVTGLYNEFHLTLSAAGAAGAGPRVGQIEEEQRKLGANHLQLTQVLGNFWQPSAAPAAPVKTPVVAAVAPQPVGKVLAAVPPPPAPTGSDAGGSDGPASDSGPAAQAPTSSSVAPQTPAPLDDGEAAFRKMMAEVQATLQSETATPEQKAAAYKQFLLLKTQRRERFK